VKLNKKVLEEMRVKPGKSADLAKRSTKRVSTDWLAPSGSGDATRKKVAEEDLADFSHELASAQDLLWASGTHALLVVIQAMDAAGKDGTIKHVMSGVNPQGCRVESFK